MAAVPARIDVSYDGAIRRIDCTTRPASGTVAWSAGAGAVVTDHSHENLAAVSSYGAGDRSATPKRKERSDEGDRYDLEAECGDASRRTWETAAVAPRDHLGRDRRRSLPGERHRGR